MEDKLYNDKNFDFFSLIESHLRELESYNIHRDERAKSFN